ncbi:hypothetical protein HYG86_12945 [Alkalicella caledoniensis]|uniref:Uncharacterized protein n=1 Tax=Alkalicella caledoniensis TaxID=2731377 RepID=A0A7G9WAA3_ALKCA|nr:hypothetical protein [Alkalicella caledoniensis]QNO15615.1 hypothetical protein HYG86_12945 [Alkalicella caledoniensis]
MPYKNIVTGDGYIFKTLLPSILLRKNLKGVYSLATLANTSCQKHNDVDVYTDFTLLPLGLHHKNIWPLCIRINDCLIFINGELAEPKGSDHWRDFVQQGEKYINELKQKDSKISSVRQIIIANEDLETETMYTKIIPWSKILQEFSFDHKDDHAYKEIKEKYTLAVGDYEDDREEEDLSFDVIKSMCRIHKDRICVLFKGGTPALTMAGQTTLRTRRYKYIISDDPLLANKERENLVRGDVFLMITSKKF